MSEPALQPPVRLTIRSDPADLPPVREAARSAALAFGFAPDDVDNLVLALDEALCNVIRHGYNGRPDGRMDVAIETAAAPRPQIRFVVRDYGKQVRPESICSRELDDIKPGGLGVHIIRSVMNEVRYAHAEGGGMKLTMCKWLP